jgi:hypothetical protein
MTADEAIVRIKKHNEIHSKQEHFAIHITEALHMAVEALKKQIPRQPIFWRHQYYDSRFEDDWGYECPCCGNRDIDYPEHHCTCGQALDWSET